MSGRVWNSRHTSDQRQENMINDVQDERLNIPNMEYENSDLLVSQVILQRPVNFIRCLGLNMIWGLSCVICRQTFERERWSLYVGIPGADDKSHNNSSRLKADIPNRYLMNTDIWFLSSDKRQAYDEAIFRIYFGTVKNHVDYFSTNFFRTSSL